MEGSASPNETLTPIYVEEELVYVPVLVYYGGKLAVEGYLNSPEE